MQSSKRILSIVLVLCLILSNLGVAAFAVDFTEKPANGTTTGQPFPSGTGGSANFRIPGIVTLDDGTLIAACDARWNHAGDGAGLDTIVSVSTDNGANWNYTFANYLGDNGNTYNTLSTCFIDPAIGTDGTTAYLIADLFPAGIALNTSKYSPIAGENGFDANGNLMLRALAEDTVAIGESGYNTMAAAANYSYYLDLETLKLYAYGAEGEADTLVTGYTVDAFFNITNDEGTLNTNLFCSDSPYQPYPTDYLYMTTSENGLDWSAPQLLNLKEDAEQSFLIGPGNGTYDADSDRLIFCAYDHTSGYERACIVWRNADGTWQRGPDATKDTWSSEMTAVVLADGTVRAFYRDGYTTLRYTDYVWDTDTETYVISAQEVNTEAIVDYGCQLTSLMYSKQIDGKDVLLVAGPTSYRRINGYIYAFLVEEDNSMELAYAHNVTTGTYAYSCLTELENGDLGLLYESAGSALTFTTIPMETLTSRKNNVNLTFVDVDVLAGESCTLTDNSGNYSDADLSALDENVAQAVVNGSEKTVTAGQLGSTSSYAGTVIDLSDCEYTFTKDGETWTAQGTDADGNAVYLYPGNSSSTGYPNRSTAYSGLSLMDGYEDDSVYIKSEHDLTAHDAAYLYFDRSNLRWDRVDNPSQSTSWATNCSVYLYAPVEGSGSTEIPGYERVTDVTAITDGNYLVAAPSDDSWYVLYPSASTANRYCQIAKVLGENTIGYTDITFTGIGDGTTEVQIGSTVYTITVKDYTEISVEIPVGGEKIITEDSGDYSDTDLRDVDDSIVKIDLEASYVTQGCGELKDAANSGTIVALSACEYTFTDTGSGTYNVTIKAGDVDTTWYVRPESKGHSNTQTALTLTFNDDNTVYLRDQNNYYLYVNRSTLAWDRVNTINDTYKPHTLFYLYAPIGEGDTSSEEIPGYKLITAADQITSGSSYLIAFKDSSGNLFCMNPTTRTTAAYNQMAAITTRQVDPSTQIKFTGLYPGQTELILAKNRYLIEVTGDVIDVDLEEHETCQYIVPAGTTLDTEPETDVVSYEIKNAVAGQLGSDASYTGELVDLENCLYTFNKNENGTYTIWATDKNGETVYLHPYPEGTNGYPHASTASQITVSDFNEGLTFTRNTSTNQTGYLFFYRDGKNMFDRVNKTSGFEAGVTFHLYEQTADGYTRISGADAIEDAGRYLIVADAGSNGKFVCYPNIATTDRYCQSAKMTDAAKVVFTAAGVGETTARIGSTIYEFSVEEHICLIPLCAEDQVCDVCGTTVTAVGHDLLTETADPTCTKMGYDLHTCQRTDCGYSYKDNYVDAAGHNMTQTEVAPTCEQLGYTTYECECGHTYISDVQDALGHSLKETVTDPTHNMMGYTTVKCENCSYLLITDYTEALEHDFDAKQTADPTCTEDGVMTFTCQCGESYTQIIPKLGHTYNEGEVTAPDCINIGYTTYECECGHTCISDVTAADGHDYEAEVTDADCINGGYTQYVCADCGDSYVDDLTDAEGHNYTETVTKPTCVSIGYTTFICADCGESHLDDMTAAEGHTLESTVTAPTHSKMGYTTTACSECDFEYIHSYTDALEHQYEKKVTGEATCTETGEMTFTCQCGESYTQAIPVTGHSCEKTVIAPTCQAMGYTVYQCKNCDHNYIGNLTEKLSHQPAVAGKKAATCCAEGYTGDVICNVCLTVLDKGTVIPVTETCVTETFTDVDREAWYHDAVDYAIANGLMNGISETRFAPTETATRAMLATLLYRMEGSPSVEGLDNPFTDVQEGTWYYAPVIWAASEGIVKGVSDTEFAPAQFITREQMVTMIYRYAGEPTAELHALQAYADADTVSNYAKNAFAWAIRNGLVNGMTETTLVPNETANRAQAATVLMRHLEN